MKPKIAAIAIIGILTLSMALIAAVAVGQVVSGDISGTGGAASNQTSAGTDRGPEDSTLFHTFRLICPFH